MSPIPDRAMSEWITRNSRRRVKNAQWRRGVACSILVLATSFLCQGCQSFAKRISQRSAECGALCNRAREARDRGNSDQANQLINEALRQKPTDFETRRQLAEVLWNNGRRDEAVAEYGALYAQQPKDAKLASRLAMMQWEANQHSTAANTALAVLNLDPLSKDAWLIKARNEVEQGRLDDALVSYMRLSQVSPDDLTAMIELGDLHLKRGNADRACPLFRTALEHPRSSDEERANVEWLLGVAYAKSERWPIAASVLESAIARRRASAEDWCLVGSVHLQCGDLTGARSDIDRALECDPDCIAARNLARQLEAADIAASAQVVTPAAYKQSFAGGNLTR